MMVVRSSNQVFILAVYGAVAGYVYEKYWDERYEYQPRQTYFDKVQARKDDLVSIGSDGYIHEYLKPGLEKMGVNVPWS